MIISNTCLAGYIYKSSNLKYNHPFIWCFMYLNDYIKLIENFQTINFLNITNCGTQNRNIVIGGKYEYRGQYFLEIDKTIKLLFRHYTNNSYNIKKIKEIYMRRANRINKDEEILFTFNYSNRFSKEYESPYLWRLVELQNRHNIVLFDHQDFYTNTTIYFKFDKCLENNKELFKRYLNV